MAEKVNIQKDLKLKQESIFDMGELYKLMYRWAKQHNYSDFIEVEYVEKINGEAKNLEIAWTCIKKINDYVKAYIEIKFMVIAMVDVEVNIDNIKRKTNKGTIDMRFTSYLKTDYEDTWASKPLTKFFRGVYDKYINKETIKDYKEDIQTELYEFMGEVKSFLNLYKFRGIQ